MSTWFGQFEEDRCIASLLANKDNGFYVDVGAWEPDVDSVTKYFYERGWHGVNIEPVPYYHNLLLSTRPRDVNLRAALGSHPGGGVLSATRDSGLSSLVSANVANARNLGFEAEPILVSIWTLEQVCDLFVGNRTIDFLKIDVEGYEAEVIAGADWSRYRPTVLCIEATHPCTLTPSYEPWEPTLLAAGYEHVASDQVNRFYRLRTS